MSEQTALHLDTERLLDVEEVAGVLHISPSTVYKLAREGSLKCVKIGAAVRFRPATVRAYIDQAETGAAVRTVPEGQGTLFGEELGVRS